jgi:hypothetical protein
MSPASMPGSDSARTSHRIGVAVRGARVAVTKTDERLPDKPSNSYRNILRAGFKAMYLRQNYSVAEVNGGSR